jgi:glycosyltransferase involved in cell wall biosynthesis
MPKRLLSVVTPCKNEEGNVLALYERVRNVMATTGEYDYEHIFIDNASTDSTPDLLRGLAGNDTRVRVIFNTRDFGQNRSPYHAIMQARGVAVIGLASDLQDPPELITDFVRKWEEGYMVVLGQKTGSEESWVIYALRTIYYRLLRTFADVPLLDHVTGFGLYDRQVVEQLRALNEPVPYVRGLVSELGYAVARVPYTQPTRKSGITKNNFYTLYDMAMLGFTSHSKVPLRLATWLGFLGALLSLLAGTGYLIYKLVYWNEISVGIAPMVIGLFFISSVQLVFLGVLGEYIGAIHTQVQHRPYVVERERLNFDEDSAGEGRG